MVSGGSAHLIAQVALAQGATVHVMTRSAADQSLARELGAASVQGAFDPPPGPWTRPSCSPRSARWCRWPWPPWTGGAPWRWPGSDLSDIPALNYQDHLFQERNLRSVTANTRSDGEELLALAEQIGVRATTTVYPFEAADQALADLAHDRFNGAAVIRVA